VITDLDTVRLFHGLDGLPFGSTVSQARDLLGSPSSEAVDEYGDTTLEFQQHGLTLTFWGDYENRLGYIGTERATAAVSGVCLFEASEAEVAEFIRDVLSGEFSERDGCEHEDGQIQTWIDCDTHGVTFWFLDDALYSIDWTCAWSDNDRPIWP